MAGFCPECGSAREDGAAFCTQCGHSFAGVRTARPQGAGGNWRRKLPRWTQRLNLPRRWRMPTAAAAAALLAVSGVSLAVWRFDLLPWGASDAAPTQQIDLDLFPVRYGDKCGFVNRDGQPAINPQFDRVGFFDARSGLAPVALGDKWGLIDRQGQYVANPQFAHLAPVRGLPNRFSAGIGDRVGIVDGTGAIIVNPQFDGVSSFVDPQGRILVRSGGKLGFIGADGAFLIPPQLDLVNGGEDDQYFRSGLLPASIDDRWGYIDVTGNWRITPQFVGASGFDEASGLAPVEIEKTETTIDQAALANWRADVLEIQARRQREIESWGYSYVRVPTVEPDFSTTTTSRLYGFVNTEGRLVIAPQYRGSTGFSDSGLAGVRVGDSWGYIDATGALKIAPQFRFAHGFKKVGDRFLAVVGIQSGSGEQAEWRHGVIDVAGNYVVQPQYDYIETYGDNGLARARVGEQWGAIDVTGKFVINPTYSRLTLLPDRSGYLFAREGAVGPEIGILGLDGTTRISVRGDICEA